MFHVPDAWRMPDGPLGSDPSFGNNGAFTLPSPEPGWWLIAIASDGEGWEHVSVRAMSKSARRGRVPAWREMVAVKDLFWDDTDLVVQFHPAKADYVNTHPEVLHLWRPTDAVVPTPPRDLV